MIAEEVADQAYRRNQEPLLILDIEKVGTDFTFHCGKFPRAGTNGVLRLIEVMNEIYQFDMKRENMDFAEETQTGFLFRCCWDTHSLNKKYRKEAYDGIS